MTAMTERVQAEEFRHFQSACSVQARHARNMTTHMTPKKQSKKWQLTLGLTLGVLEGTLGLSLQVLGCSLNLNSQSRS